MDGNNDSGKKVIGNAPMSTDPTERRTRIYKRDLDVIRIDNFDDLIEERKRREEASKRLDEEEKRLAVGLKISAERKKAEEERQRRAEGGTET
uniref:Uncharacterized protein n=1 Tax=Tetranychus urticae TaxID=32264 RepID=T1KH61_TETUR